MHSVLSSSHRLLSQSFAFSNHPSHPCAHLTEVSAFRRIQMLLLASYFISRVTLEGKLLLCICWSIPIVCQLLTLFWLLSYLSSQEIKELTTSTKEFNVTTNKWKIIRYYSAKDKAVEPQGKPWKKLCSQ